MYSNPIYQSDYLNRKICEQDQSIDEKQGKHELKFLKHTKIYDNTELFGINSGRVHMYQTDISVLSAIDYAFLKNSIFCIKAFVDTLLLLKDEQPFRGCFDKAVLLMISRNMDIKDLVQSSLFYPQIWQDVSIFSHIGKPVIIPYNKEIDDLEFEMPELLFKTYDSRDSNGRKESVILRTMQQKIYNKFSYYQVQNIQDILHTTKQEYYEM